MDNSVKDINELIGNSYVPTSIERKKAVLMYFLIGILVAVAKSELSKYERYHLKQAIGYWCVFFLCLGLIIFAFFPLLWVMPLLVYMIIIVIWIYFINQAWNGYYVIDGNKIVLPFFAGLGSWVLDVFEVDVGSDIAEGDYFEQSDDKDLLVGAPDDDSTEQKKSSD